MEVPGKREDPDPEKGSQGNAEEFCQPCSYDGNHVAAEGFCKTCDDYLCAECFKTHTRPHPMRNHVLLDRSNMPRSALGTRKPKTTCTIICPHHHDKVIEFFCPKHSAVLCGVCAVVEHIQCKNIYIPDVAEEYKKSREYTGLLDTLNHLETDIKSLSTDIKGAISSVRESSAKAIQKIRQFRKELNDYLDKIEQELVLATRKKEQEDTKLLQNLTDELDSLKDENSCFMKQLKSVDNEISDLFVTSKQLIKQGQSVLDRFVRCIEKNETISYTFEKGHALTDLIVSNTDFGQIKKTCQPKTASYGFKNIAQMAAKNIDFTSKAVERKSDITVRTEEDTTKPRITGMVLLSPHTLLLADYNNSSVKTVDTTSNTILSRLSLWGQPWDIALLPKDQAAVTIVHIKKIQIISTKEGLSAVRTMNVDAQCFGISATIDKLIVSFVYPMKVDIMNFHGDVLVSMRTDSKGQALFSSPDHIKVVVENEVPVIHVSDRHKNTITKFSLGGQVLYIYTQKNWRGLSGMTATEDEQLLVCNRDNNTVDVISEGGNVIQTLLGSKQGIKCPVAICYCAEHNMLYVTSATDGTVQAYKYT